jgi:class 3 adenylate cyclase
MSRRSDPISTVRRIVLAFDICSSTVILEDLLRTENQRRWRNLLIGMKRALVREAAQTPFEIYKFVGDGWILLFEHDSISGPTLMRFLQTVSAKYQDLFHHGICEVLGISDQLVGLTFGIDFGTLVKVVMNNKAEYIGRALNVAVRLQSAVKDCDKDPRDRLLISKNAYAHLKLGRTRATVGTLAECNLRGVAGGEKYQARKLVVLK